MSEKFSQLSKEHQLKIINAGLECFGKYGYQKANTEDIAKKAGISKGLLFYYFKNKQSFYLYLYDFCEKMAKKYMQLDEIKEITDFFDLLDYGTIKKLKMIEKYPYMLNFLIKMLYSQKNEVFYQRIQRTTQEAYTYYFQYIDRSRFKEGVDPFHIYKMLLWMGEGYLVEKVRQQQEIDVEELMNEFESWKKMFKEMCYRKEYL